MMFCKVVPLLLGFLAFFGIDHAVAQQYGLSQPLTSTDQYARAPTYQSPSQTANERDALHRRTIANAKERLRQREALRKPSARYTDPLVALDAQQNGPATTRRGDNAGVRQVTPTNNRATLVPQR